jgi:integrase
VRRNARGPAGGDTAACRRGPHGRPPEDAPAGTGSGPAASWSAGCRACARQPSGLGRGATSPTGGATLHQLRHSALTQYGGRHGTPMLMARSRHTSVRSLVKYARVSVEALQRHQAQRDSARRR